MSGEGKYSTIDRWERGHGRWNNSTAYVSHETGLVYLVHEFGSGRWKDGWSLLVFAPRTKLSPYQGKQSAGNISRGCQPLFKLAGSGGFDTGKPAISKGGFRPGGRIAYRLEDDGSELDGELLWDGDRLLRQVLGIEELTVQTVRQAATVREERLRQEAEQKAQEQADDLARFRAESEAQQRAWQQEREAALARFTAEFAAPPPLPEGCTGSVTAAGYVVTWAEGDRSPRTFLTTQQLTEWIQEEREARIRAAEYARQHELKEEERLQQQAAKDAAVKKALPSVLSRLGRLKK